MLDPFEQPIATVVIKLCTIRSLLALQRKLLLNRNYKSKSSTRNGVRINKSNVSHKVIKNFTWIMLVTTLRPNLLFSYEIYVLLP